MYTMYINWEDQTICPMFSESHQSRRVGNNTEALTSCEMGSQSVQALLLLKHLEETQASSGDDASGRWGNGCQCLFCCWGMPLLLFNG